MRNIVLLGLALILGLSIGVIATAISAFHAAIPGLVQAIGNAFDNAIVTLMLEVCIVLVISLAFIALIRVGHISRLIFLHGPEALLFVAGLLLLFEALKERLGFSP